MPNQQPGSVITGFGQPERTMATDEELILEFQRGSQAAFEELFGRYREAIYGFFRRRLNDASRAEDLAQETFVAVLHNRERYEPRSLVRTYLYGIALKQLAAERRQITRRAAEPAGETLTSSDPDAALCVRQALEKLDFDFREIVMLREYEELSYAEIALLVRIPVNTVRSRLFRARMELKNLLVAERKPH